MTQQIIHDVAYDYFGRRVAVCSSDQWIKIYDDECKTAEWKAHGGSIWRLAWAHPEFGQVLASCSFDRKICIWEERGDTEESTLASNGAWRLARELQEPRDSVCHVTFAPKRWGLLLASCSADRKVRLHEAPDVMDLGSWGLTAEFEAEAGKGRAAVAPLCVAWNPSPTEPLMLVIGMSDGSAILWRQQENSDAWVRVLAFDSAPACEAELPHHAQVWRVAWNNCGSMLASSVDDGSMHVYKMGAEGGWEQVSFIEPTHTSDVKHVTMPGS